MTSTTTLVQLLKQAAGRPGLLVAMLRAAWRFRARGWWRRPPFLPLPPREYLEWRMHTAYGDDGSPTGAELDRYLRWANDMYSTRRGRERSA